MLKDIGLMIRCVSVRMNGEELKERLREIQQVGIAFHPKDLVC
jgi:hypothetical protein